MAYDLPEDLLQETFLASTGPGGQNVNKVATACQLRVDVYALRLAPYAFRQLKLLAGSKMTLSGELVVTARNHRTREANRAEARERVIELLDRAHIRQARRVATKPSRAAKAKRVDTKRGARPSRKIVARSVWTDKARDMYEFAIDTAAPKHELYRELVRSADALTEGEPDAIANMANVAALLWEYLPDVNWTGFYRMVDDELVLGPFQGKAACIRIALGEGVCGTAAASGETQRIDDVHNFAGHIACDANSASELVVPVKREGRIIAVIDLDSPLRARFDDDDAAGIETLAELLSSRI